MKKAVVLRLSSLGDVILASSVCNFLSKRCERVFYITLNKYTGLFKGTEEFETVAYESFYKRLDELRRPDLLYDLHTTPRTRQLLKEIAGTNTQIFRWKAERAKRWLFCLTHRGKIEHVLCRFSKEACLNNAKPVISVNRDDEIKAIHLLGKYPASRRIALVPGAHWPSKRYFPHGWEVISQMLRKRGYVTYLILGPRENSIAHQFRTESFTAVFKDLPLNVVAGLLANVRLTIGCDTGLIHLSEAVGTPVLVVYTSTSPHLGYTPHLPESTWVWSKMWCSPCSPHGRRWCAFALSCRKRPAPEKIAEKALNLLEN